MTHRKHFKETLLPDHDFLGNLFFRRLLSARSFRVFLDRVSPAHSDPGHRVEPSPGVRDTLSLAGAASRGGGGSRPSAPSPPLSSLLSGRWQCSWCPVSSAPRAVSHT